MREVGALLDGFAGLDVLVVGESFLDGWLRGPSRRLSREAPVPIVDVTDTVLCPGAAANTAANAAALGARVSFLSVVGDDDDGRTLARELAGLGVPADDVLVDPGRRTVAKRRILAGGQMLTRVDQGDGFPLAGPIEARLLAQLATLVPAADVVVACDYGHGLFTPAVLDLLTALEPTLLVVDAREPGCWRRVRPAAVTPNWDEARGLLPHLPAPRPEGDRPTWLESAGRELLEASGARVAAVTLDVDGGVLLERDRPGYRLYAQPVPHSQAAGAGDTFAAAFALALGAGADAPTAAELAAAAAAVVVRRPGTSLCSATDLQAALSSSDRTPVDLPSLTARVAAHRAAGARIVFTNGCFDVLHRGHVTLLNRAKALGDVLVVGLNSDASVARLKGPARPVNGMEDRAAVLGALSCVDHLVVFDGETAADVLEAIRPDVYAKGGDYTADMLPEAPLVARLGGVVRILDYLEDRSTSGLIERIRAGR